MWRDLTSGTVVTFTEKTSGLATNVTYTGSEHQLVVNLQDGTFTVSAPHYVSQELVVENGAVNSFDLKLTRNILYSNGKDTDLYTITEDENGGKVVFTGDTFKKGYAIVNGYGSKYIVEATYTGVPNWGDGMSFLDSNGAYVGYLANIAYWSNNIGIKWKNDILVYSNQANNYKQNDGNFVIQIKIAIDGSNVTCYMSLMKTDGTYEEFATKTITAPSGYVYIGFSAHDAKTQTYSNIKVYKV